MTENFALSGTIKLLEALPNRKRKICGIASHGGLTTYHKGEIFNKRHYVTGELQEAVVRVQKQLPLPLMLNHETPLPGCDVTVMRWDDKENGVYYEAEISNTVAGLIENGKINGCSLYSNPWITGGGVKWADGFAPFGFRFEELSLTDDRMIPGDPQATVRFLEALEKTFEIDPKHVKEINRAKFIEQLENQVPDRLLKNPPIQEATEKDPGKAMLKDFIQQTANDAVEKAYIEKPEADLKINPKTEQDVQDCKDIIRMANNITAARERLAQAEKPPVQEAETEPPTPEATIQEVEKSEREVSALEQFRKRRR